MSLPLLPSLAKLTVRDVITTPDILESILDHVEDCTGIARLCIVQKHVCDAIDWRSRVMQLYKWNYWLQMMGCVDFETLSSKPHVRELLEQMGVIDIPISWFHVWLVATQCYEYIRWINTKMRDEDNVRTQFQYLMMGASVNIFRYNSPQWQAVTVFMKTAGLPVVVPNTVGEGQPLRGSPLQLLIAYCQYGATVPDVMVIREVPFPEFLITLANGKWRDVVDLRLNNKKMNDSDLQLLQDVCNQGQLHRYTLLNLSNNTLSQQAILKFLHSKTCPNIKMLYLNSLAFDNIPMLIMDLSMAVNTLETLTLHELDMDNTIAREVFRALAQAEVLPYLNSLSVTFNPFNDVDILREFLSSARRPLRNLLIPRTFKNSLDELRTIKPETTISTM